MQIKIRNLGILNSLLVLLAVIFLFNYCASDGKKKSVEDDIDESIELDEELVDDFNQAKTVLYSLPSPIETIMLIKRAGATFSEEYLNPTENSSNYSKF